MIKITNGVVVIQVTNGAYKEQYKPLGWLPVNEDAPANQKPLADEAEGKKVSEQGVPGVDHEDEKVSEENQDEENQDEGEKSPEETKQQFVPEKPLSEMSNAELREKAKQLNVDISGLESRKQVRAAISAAMRG